ncbi:MAG: hypothetical protein ER33_13055 [Cyanobium sp. CACIAM 14]|nr:MAG: hypothetical protein ER33_13055 [Cyanobium sp. CACIAM 14]
MSWHQVLLFPPWLRRTSSPISSIGTPGASSRLARRLRSWRSRRAFTAGSVQGPSTPWFQLLLWLSPSRSFSPLARLCLRSKLTRSARVKPSWAVRKLIVRPTGAGWPLNRSGFPDSRWLSGQAVRSSPFQNRRRSSRKRPFQPATRRAGKSARR